MTAKRQVRKRQTATGMVYFCPLCTYKVDVSRVGINQARFSAECREAIVRVAGHIKHNHL